MTSNDRLEVSGTRPCTKTMFRLMAEATQNELMGFEVMCILVFGSVEAMETTSYICPMIFPGGK